MHRLIRHRWIPTSVVSKHLHRPGHRPAGGRADAGDDQEGDGHRVAGGHPGRTRQGRRHARLQRAGDPGRRRHMADRWYVRATAAFRRPRTWAWIGAVIVATGVTWRLQAVDGQVVDAATGKPLEGVFVLGQWNGYITMPAQGRSTCYHLAVTRSDTQGKFLMSSWSGNFHPLLGDRVLTLYYYKPGYATQWSAEEYSQPMALTRDMRLGKERMDEIGKMLVAADCGPRDRKLDRVGSLYRAAAEEAKNVAVTREERTQANRFLGPVEALQFGDWEAARRQSERERAEWTRE